MTDTSTFIQQAQTAIATGARDEARRLLTLALAMNNEDLHALELLAAMAANDEERAIYQGRIDTLRGQGAVAGSKTSPTADPSPAHQQAAPSLYTVTGTVANEPGKLYVRREADDELYEYCKAGEFCYILTSRQRGKSSLRLRTAQRLREEGVHVATVDLQGIGSSVREDQFYVTVLTQLCDELGGVVQTEPVEWWLARQSDRGQTAARLFQLFLRDEIMQAIEGRLILFVDEVDYIRKMQFDSDDFFALVRSIHESRHEQPAFRRLSFVLIGTARPRDLIQDNKRTPFNIGRPILLDDFTPGQMAELSKGLPLNGLTVEEVTGWVYAWTAGHPFLSQRVYEALARHLAKNPDERLSQELVEQTVNTLFLERRRTGEDSNLNWVRDELWGRRAETGLTPFYIYAAVRWGEAIDDDEFGDMTAKEVLKLSGLVRVEADGRFAVRNAIYERLFDEAWLYGILHDDNIPRPEVYLKTGVANFMKDYLEQKERRAEATGAQKPDYTPLSSDPEAPPVQPPVKGPDEAGEEKPAAMPSPDEAYGEWVSSLDLDRADATEDATLPEWLDAPDEVEVSAEEAQAGLRVAFSRQEEAPAPPDAPGRFTKDKDEDADSLFGDDFDDDDFDYSMDEDEDAPAAGPVQTESGGQGRNIFGRLFGWLTFWRSGESEIEKRLAHINTEGFEAMLEEAETADAGPVRRSGVSSAIETLDRALEGRTYVRYTRDRLARANLKLTPGEYHFLRLGTAVMAGLLTLLFFGVDNLLAAVVATVVGGFLPVVFLIQRAVGRMAQFEAQLPATLQLWVNALRSGYSVLQAMEALAKDAPEPTRTEFRRVVQEVQLGIPREEAYDHLLQRMPSEDLDLIITAVNIQAEVGGNLAEILDVISHTIRERIRLADEVRILFFPVYRFYLALVALLGILQWTVLRDYFAEVERSTVGGVASFSAYAMLAGLIVIHLYVHPGHRRRSVDLLFGGLLILLMVLLEVPPPILGLVAVLLVAILVPRLSAFLLAVGGLGLLVVFLSVVLYTDIVPLPDLGAGEGGDLLPDMSAGGLLLVSLLLLALVGLLVWLARRGGESDPLKEADAAYGEAAVPTSLEELELSVSVRERLWLPLLQRLEGMVTAITPQAQLDSIRQRLAMAGSPRDPVMVLVQSVALALLGLLGALVGLLLLSDLNLLAVLVLALLAGWAGYWLPRAQLASNIRQRKEAVQAALPEALDLLVICVEAGLGFDTAMAKVYEKWDNPLALALGRVAVEMQMGKARREALRDMAERLDVPEVQTFVAALVQADQLGVSVAKILRVQSDEMRVKQRQGVQGQVSRASSYRELASQILLAPAVLLWLVAPLLEGLL